MDLDLPNRNSRSDSRVRLVALKLGPAVKHGRHPTVGTDEYSPNLATPRKPWGLGNHTRGVSLRFRISQERQGMASWFEFTDLRRRRR